MSLHVLLITRRIAEKFHDTDPDGVKAFLGNVGGSNPAKPALDQILARLDGRGNVPQSEMWHRIGSTARAFYDMVYLLTVHGVMVAKGEQVGHRTAQGGEQRGEFPARVAPQHRLVRRLRARVVIRRGAKGPDQRGERGRHFAAVASAAQAARFSSSVV
jgi:hypothetical protein